MTTKKIPISFNDTDQKNIKELIVMMGITDTYGALPKAIKFGIKLAIEAIKNPSKVYSGLNDEEMEFFFESVQREAKRRLERKAELYRKRAEKYN